MSDKRTTSSPHGWRGNQWVPAGHAEAADLAAMNIARVKRQMELEERVKALEEEINAAKDAVRRAHGHDQYIYYDGLAGDIDSLAQSWKTWITKAEQYRAALEHIKDCRTITAIDAIVEKALKGGGE